MAADGCNVLDAFPLGLMRLKLRQQLARSNVTRADWTIALFRFGLKGPCKTDGVRRDTVDIVWAQDTGVAKATLAGLSHNAPSHFSGNLAAGQVERLDCIGTDI